MKQNRYNTGTGRITLVAVLSALSFIFLYVSAIVPTAQMGVVAIAGLFPAGAVVSAGLGAGFFCYSVSGLLGLLLIPNKGNALLYLLFLGLWPMLKSLCERLSNRWLEWVCKLAIFNAALSLLWIALRSVLLPFLPVALNSTWLIYLTGNVVFLIYDIGFSKLIAFYVVRIDRVLRKTN